MKFNQLKEYDSSLELISSRVEIEEFNILGLSSLSNARPAYVCFLKNTKFLNKFADLAKKNELKEVGLILGRGFYQGLLVNPEMINLLESNSSFIGVVDNIDISISYLSKPFYDELLEGVDFLKEGRGDLQSKIDPSAKIAASAFVGDGVEIAAGVEILPGAVILAGSKIGAGTIIFPNVTIYENVTIGKNCRIHAGSVIGADGFGYNFKGGVHHKVWHLGSVTIGDDVEIGSNSSVDRGTFDDTTIGSGTKIDNLVQIAHNCHVGRGVILCGQSALAGSGTVGDFSVFAGRSGLGPDITIGRGCQVAAGSLIGCDWPDGSMVAGHPARPVKEWLKGLAYIRKNSLKK